MATDLEFLNRIPFFFDLLGQQPTGIPVQSQWVLEFSSLPSSLINQVVQYESFFNNSVGINGSNWNINGSVAIATSETLQQLKGCIFAQSVIMPPEGMNTERVGDYNGAYVKGLSTTSRVDFGTFSVAFLETNLSFADTVLRPWAIMVGHRSLIAREETLFPSIGGDNMKVNLQVYHLAKAGYGVPPVVRKQFNFFDCVPVLIDQEEYSSEGDKVIQRQIQFLYSYYTISVGLQEFQNTSPGLFTGEPVFNGKIIPTPIP